jgi:hypothetical protein
VLSIPVVKLIDAEAEAVCELIKTMLPVATEAL